MGSSTSYLKSLRKLAKKYGREMQLRSKHIALVDPNGVHPFVICTATCNDQGRQLKNIEADLRRTSKQKRRT